MAGISTEGITLSYKTSSTGTYTEIANLQEVPQIGQAPNRIDVTCLKDKSFKYIKGLIDYGELKFTLLFDNSDTDSNYRVCRGLEESEDIVYWQLEFPDAVTDSTGHGTQFQFEGQCTTATVGKGKDDALQFELNVILNSDITVVDPT